MKKCLLFYRRKRTSGGRCWRFSGGLPKFLFVNENQESVPSMI